VGKSVGREEKGGKFIRRLRVAASDRYVDGGTGWVWVDVSNSLRGLRVKVAWVEPARAWFYWCLGDVMSVHGVVGNVLPSFARSVSSSLPE
jgi:hypothetical protein